MNTINLQPVLTGNLLKLEPLKSSDFESVYSAASDPLIWEQHPDNFRFKREVFQKYFDSAIESKGAFLIRSVETNEVIGSSRYYNFNPENKEIMVGYTFLKREYWGGNWNRELKHLMLEHAFQFVNSVLFEVGALNMRSQKALAKIGANRIDDLVKVAPDGREFSNLVFQIEKPDFKGLL